MENLKNIPEYAESDFAKAMITAFNAGMLSTHFVIVNPSHFERLRDEGGIIGFGSQWMKTTSKKPVFFAYEFEG